LRIREALNPAYFVVGEKSGELEVWQMPLSENNNKTTIKPNANGLFIEFIEEG
jgi:hypothetical protein